VQAAGFLLAAGCAVFLVAKAQDGVRTTDALSSPAGVAQAGVENAYYSCLSAQAQKLVLEGESVALTAGSESGAGSALFSAVVGWAHITSDPRDAVVVLGIVPGHGPGSCDGSLVVASPGGAQ
jgi:hypothetical protein